MGRTDGSAWANKEPVETTEPLETTADEDETREPVAAEDATVADRVEQRGGCGWAPLPLLGFLLDLGAHTGENKRHPDKTP